MQACAYLSFASVGITSPPMKVSDIRRANVTALIRDRFHDSVAEFARAIERDDAQVWALVNESAPTARNIGERLARHIENQLRLDPNTLDVPMFLEAGGQLRVESPAATYKINRIPVVGTAELGEDGFHLELEYPTGHGEGYIDYPSRDPNAYVVRGKGDSMRPRIKPGEFIMVWPNWPVNPGDEVLLRTRSGRAMVKVFDFRRDGVVQVSSVNENHRPLTIEEADIERLHYVAAIVKAGMYYRDIA